MRCSIPLLHCVPAARQICPPVSLYWDGLNKQVSIPCKTQAVAPLDLRLNSGHRSDQQYFFILQTSLFLDSSLRFYYSSGKDGRHWKTKEIHSKVCRKEVIIIPSGNHRWKRNTKGEGESHTIKCQDNSKDCREEPSRKWAPWNPMKPKMIIGVGWRQDSGSGGKKSVCANISPL